ncbi:hypothetical protein F53441_13149 [Fusarium austroafricanum]|uniref:Amidase domain-containing protein n=1 Tax=Fusarium austroafricanum TaxID=2364996 RepID=A0A8H4NSK0_9HYPO|nr:hypothetical protein F53441_13149 [Fusarium austroafricanum]
MDVRPSTLNTIKLQHHNVTIRDIRGEKCRDFNLEIAGFEVVENKGMCSDFQPFVDSDKMREDYRAETEMLLKRHFNAEEVVCYGFKTLHSCTWRPLIPRLEDNLLAVCDFRSVDPDDLVVTDRILPTEYWTMYFLKHNPKQRWHWLSGQTPDELILMLMYDTKAGGARWHLRQLLYAGETTSVELVNLYLTQIEMHNHHGLKIHAITQTAPAKKLLEQAVALDAERRKSGPRGPLHGIPITLKVRADYIYDFYLTPSFGMDTTCGSYALKGLKATEDAAIATMLRDAGCIIIGLNNLSEWANCRGANLTSGWSAMGGQTQTPYVRGGVDPKDKWMGHTTPGGSSSGSAVGTASGFSPFSIGSESDGSIIQPSIRAALYSIKGTVGDINMKGTMSGGAGFDSAGPIAKSVEDCAHVLDVLLPGRDFRSHLTKSWKGIKVAYLDYKKWQFEDWICDPTPAFDTEHEQAMLGAMKKLENAGASVSYNAPLLMPQAVVEKYKTASFNDLQGHELKFTFERFLALFDSPKLRTLKDLVEFNNENAKLELPPDQPSQSVFESALKNNITEEEYETGLKHLRASFRDAIEKCLEETGADVIMGSGETFMSTMAAGSGYPIASVPLGFTSYNGRPHGMLILARNQEEGKILKVMSAWEDTFPEARKPPPRLLEWDSDSEL